MYEPIMIFNKVCVRVREGSGGEEMGGEGKGSGGGNSHWSALGMHRALPTLPTGN